VLGKLDVVRKEAASGGTNILIAVGQPGHALEPPDLTTLAAQHTGVNR
jgi:hypothetical protein